MIYQPSNIIQQALLAKQIRCEVQEGPDSSAVVTGFDLKSGDAATFHFISSGDRNDVALRAFHFAHVAPDRAGAILPVVNDINSRYRYAKFVLQPDGDIRMEMDIPQETANLDKVAFELLVRSLDILGDAAPDLKAAGATLQPAQNPEEPEPQPEPQPEPAPKKKFHFFGGNGK